LTNWGKGALINYHTSLKRIRILENSAPHLAKGRDPKRSITSEFLDVLWGKGEGRKGRGEEKGEG